MLGAACASAATVTDSFDRADGGLGGSWTVSAISSAPLQVTSQQVTLPQYQEGLSLFTGASLGGDQFSELRYASGFGAIGLYVRTRQFQSVGTGDGYVGQVLDLGYGKPLWRILRVDNEIETQLAVGSLSYSSGDTFYFEAVGNTLTMKRNGVVLGSVNDGTYSAGQTGISLYNRSTLRLDDYRGGDLGTTVATPASYTVNAAVAATNGGSGSVTCTTGGATAACGSYVAGTTVTLTATPGSGSVFTGWSGACTGTAACSVTLSGAVSVTASFERPLLTVSVSGSGGTVSSSPAGINACAGGSLCSAAFAAGTVVTLTASGSGFGGWGGACTGTGSCAVTLGSSKSVTASFGATTASAVTVSDGMNRSDGALGSNWMTGADSSAPLRIAGNQLTVTQYQEGQAIYSGTTLGADQFSELQFAGGQGVLNLFVRSRDFLVAGAFDGYIGQVLQLGAVAATWRILRLDNDYEHVLASGSLTLVAGDTFNFEAQGTTLTLRRNGVTIGAVSDGNYASGYVGVGLYNRSGLTADNFRGGSSTGTSAGTPPTVPANLRVQAGTLTSTAVTLAWDASSSNGSAVAGYQVFRDGALRGSVTALSFADQSPALTPGTTYQYSVLAIDLAGRLSAQSALFAVTTPAAAAPTTTTTPATPVTPVTPTTSVGNGTAVLAWSAPTANTDGSVLTDLTGFNVYYGRDPANLKLWTTLDCSWCLWTNVTGLSSGTWYFAVRSFNKAGLEGPLSTVTNKVIN